MECSASTRFDSSTPFEWYYQSDDVPFTAPHLTEWTRYSDVEIYIIEEAYNAKHGYATLDDSIIDFAVMVQVFNNVLDRQRSVKRVVYNRNTMNLRKERFMYDFAISKHSFRDNHGWISPLISIVIKGLDLEEKQLSSWSDTILLKIVEKAASGIVEGGKQIRRKCEAEWMAKQLMGKKNSGMEEIWKCCANLYSKESFLYKEINKVMRTIGNDEDEQVWRNKLPIFGPFCLLILSNSFNAKPKGKTEPIYRGATLSPAEIDYFKNDCSQKPTPERSFQAFTSCSRNRALAELCGGNTLLIMKVTHAFTLDLVPFSDYPHEDEELIYPGACFTVERVEFEKVKNMYVIYLNVIHQLAGK